MPTYAYACTACGYHFDAVQSFSDASLTECPECDGTLRKRYGSIGVTFNGGGFYRTDSRSTGSGDTGTSAPAGAGSTSAPAASSKPDKAPASGA